MDAKRRRPQRYIKQGKVRFAEARSGVFGGLYVEDSSCRWNEPGNRTRNEQAEAKGAERRGKKDHKASNKRGKANPARPKIAKVMARK